MCGINSMIINENTRRSALGRSLIVQIFTEGLVQAENRGDHATGVAFITKDGHARIVKTSLPAHVFVRTREYQDLMEVVKKASSGILLGHTRLATQGDFEDNRNNHPFHVGTVVGVHNGVVTNYYDKLPFMPNVEGECDSEIIFHSLARRSGKTGLNQTKIQTALRVLEGDFALAFVDLIRPTELHLVRQTNPLSIMRLSRLGVTLINSISSYMTDAVETVKRMAYAWSPAQAHQANRLLRSHYLTSLTKGDYLVLNTEGRHRKGKVIIPERKNKWGGRTTWNQPKSLADIAKRCYDCGAILSDEELELSWLIPEFGEPLCGECLAYETDLLLESTST